MDQCKPGKRCWKLKLEELVTNAEEITQEAKSILTDYKSKVSNGSDAREISQLGSEVGVHERTLKGNTGRS